MSEDEVAIVIETTITIMITLVILVLGGLQLYQSLKPSESQEVIPNHARAFFNSDDSNYVTYNIVDENSDENIIEKPQKVEKKKNVKEFVEKSSLPLNVLPFGYRKKARNAINVRTLPEENVKPKKENLSDDSEYDYGYSFDESSTVYLHRDSSISEE